MKPRVVFPKGLHDELVEHLFGGENGAEEQAAFCFAAPAVHAAGELLLVRRVVPVPTEGFFRRGRYGFELTQEFKVEVMKIARASGLHVIEVHSHPDAELWVQFSPTDEEGQQAFQRYLSWKLPGRSWAALVYGRASVAGTYWAPGAKQPVPIAAVEAVDYRRHRIGELAASGEIEPRYARQAAFGEAGQRELAQLRVVLVGAGGLGTVIATQLILLGVRDLVLIDFDKVEDTNLNRLLGCFPGDEGLNKINCLKTELLKYAPEASITVLPYSVRDSRALEVVKLADYLIGAVDNDGARELLNRIAVAYLIPYLDAASDVLVSTEDGSIEIGGRLRFTWPGGSCLACEGALKLSEIQEFFRTEADRGNLARLGCGAGTGEKAPSVIHVNMKVGGSVVQEFHAAVTEFQKPAPGLMLRSSRAKRECTQQVPKRKDCPVCAVELGAGDFSSVTRMLLPQTQKAG